MTRALILVDIQNDFMAGGTLAVPDGDAIIPVARILAARFETVVATQDWHPAGHESFARMHEGRAPGEVIELHGLSQVLWPAHCVQGSPGARLVDGIRDVPLAAVFQKGQTETVDSYSGFFDNGRRQRTGLDHWLRSRGVHELFLSGVATDYCVRATALDARSLGYETKVVVDACRGVGLGAGDVEDALREMAVAGVTLVTADEVGESVGLTRSYAGTHSRPDG